MTAAQWKRAGIVFGVLASIGTLARCAEPLRESDSPPFASIGRVMDAFTGLQGQMDVKANGLEALILEGQILGMWRARCEAVLSHNMIAARSYDSEISRIQSRYQTVAGHQFILGQCL